jgi:hypothetical protein
MIIEILISILCIKLFNFNYGLSILFFLLGLFKENCKLKLSYILLSCINLFFGLKYIIFFILCSLLIFLIYIYDFEIKTIKCNDSINEIYELTNLVLYIPISIVYDNCMYFYNFIKTTNILNNKLCNYLKEKYNLINNIYNNKKILETTIDINKIESMNDNEFNSYCSELFDMKNLLNMTNNIRLSIGKNIITEKEINNELQKYKLENIFSLKL